MSSRSCWRSAGATRNGPSPAITFTLNDLSFPILHGPTILHRKAGSRGDWRESIEAGWQCLLLSGGSHLQLDIQSKVEVTYESP